MRVMIGGVAIVLVLFGVAPDARAQSTYSLDVRESAGSSIARMLVFSSPSPAPAARYSPDTQESLTASAAEAYKYDQALFSILQRQVSTFPIGSASGGFSYVFNPQLGLPTRRTRSFGPMFAERPMTGGNHRFSASLVLQGTTWQGVGGVDFRKGFTGTRTYAAAETASGDPEITSTTLHMTFTTGRGALALNYGLTDRIDVGLLLTSGSTVVSWSGVGTERDLTTGQALVINEQKSYGASAGIGDTTVRMKMEFLSRPALDLAAGVDVRLPTGKADDLLGIGATQTRVLLVGAFPHEALSPHFNIGYTYVPGYTPGISVPYALCEQCPGFIVQAPNIQNSDELNYTVGMDAAVSSTLTLAGDVIGRSLLRSYNFERTVDPTVSQISMTPGTAHLLVGALGGKMRVSGSWLLNMSAAFPLTNAGVKPGITGVIGLEHMF